ncbi:MAG: OmpH family outer membrane protein [Bacteroidetes bacterium]|nr:MAG: OmpH family outer membrane protein [Bacteroidota bacterium]
MMKIKTFFLMCLVLVGLAGTSFAQKIGYANVDLILVYMPETKSMNQTLQTYQQKLGEQLQSKQQYAQSKLQEYQAKAQNGATEEELKPLQEELIRLDEEIKKAAADADQKLLKRRQELLQPITEKLGNAIKAVATEQGFDYVLNTVDGSGVSLVLHGPEGNDITETVMRKLGIQLPQNSGGR